MEPGKGNSSGKRDGQPGCSEVAEAWEPTWGFSFLCRPDTLNGEKYEEPFSLHSLGLYAVT